MAHAFYFLIILIGVGLFLGSMMKDTSKVIRMPLSEEDKYDTLLYDSKNEKYLVAQVTEEHPELINEQTPEEVEQV